MVVAFVATFVASLALLPPALAVELFPALVVVALLLSYPVIRILQALFGRLAARLGTRLGPPRS